MFIRYNAQRINSLFQCHLTVLQEKKKEEEEDEDEEEEGEGGGEEEKKKGLGEGKNTERT